MATKQILDGHPDGTVIGSSSELIAFFGGTPRVKGTAVVSIAATATTAILKNRINAIMNRLKSLGLIS